MNQDSVDLNQAVTPSLPRRLAAILYDSLLLLSLLVVAAALATLVVQNGLGIPIVPSHPLYRGYLLLVGILFFVYFWVRGGQTLGMRAWRLRVLRADGLPLRPLDAVLRALCALLSWAVMGLGFAWALADPERLAWHDRLSRTRLVLTARPENSPEGSP